MPRPPPAAVCAPAACSPRADGSFWRAPRRLGVRPIAATLLPMAASPAACTIARMCSVRGPCSRQRHAVPPQDLLQQSCGGWPCPPDLRLWRRRAGSACPARLPASVTQPCCVRRLVGVSPAGSAASSRQSQRRRRARWRGGCSCSGGSCMHGQAQQASTGGLGSTGEARAVPAVQLLRLGPRLCPAAPPGC